MAYNIFISHAWSYDERYQGIVAMLDSGGFAWKDMSAPRDYPIVPQGQRVTNAHLEAAIDNRIRNSSGVIISAGMFVNHSEWVQFEIDVAKSYNKKIIGVRRRNQQLTPAIVLNVADEMVNWYAPSLVKAVEEHF